MLSKELSREIITASEEMDANGLLEFLQRLERGQKVEISYDGWSYSIDFAKHLVGQMAKALDGDQWYGYETRALRVLEDMYCRPNDIIRVNNYGFPEEIKDNNDLLYVLGLLDQLS